MSRFHPRAVAPPRPPEEPPEIDEPEAPGLPPDPGTPYPVPDPGVPYPVPDPGNPPDPEPPRESLDRARQDPAPRRTPPPGARLALTRAGNSTAVSELGRGVPRGRLDGSGLAVAGASPAGEAVGVAGVRPRLVAIPPLISLEGGCVLLAVPDASRAARPSVVPRGSARVARVWERPSGRNEREGAAGVAWGGPRAGGAG